MTLREEEPTNPITIRGALSKPLIHETDPFSQILYPRRKWFQ